MYMCSCNPFSDKKVKEYLTQAGETNTVRVAEIYKACSGGAKPQCATCLPALKDMVTEHNNTVLIHRMKEGLPVSTPAPAQAPKPNQPVS